jgi:HKD family nuclease
MYQHDFFVQTREHTGEILRGLVLTATSAQFNQVTIAIAYATKVGCKFLNESFNSNVQGWRRLKKKWLVSIDHGTTEPAALEFLSGMSNSEVRIANAELVLRAHLRPKTSFHNKLYFFEGRDDESPIGLFSGSANLTLSGLYVNNEQATASILTPPFSKSDRAYYDHIKRQIEVINSVFASSALLDDELLSKYREIWKPRRSSEDRTKLVRRISNPAEYLPLSKAVAIAAARYFWTEVKYVVPNLGQGVPGNQIDLQRGSRVFFDFSAKDVPRNTVLGSVLIRFGGEVVDCHMRFGNNQMDKLNLPRPSTHGVRNYRNQTLLFKRNEDGIFDLHIGSPQEIADWKRRSRHQGTLYRMQGGREYGVFK